MTRYVENSKGLWVPDYTVGSGLGTNLARLAYRAGFKQKPGCGCPRKQALLDRWTASGVAPPMYRGNALPILAGGTGEEAKCTSLGSNCLCSEPFQMTSYNKQGSGADAYWQPNDTATKKCTEVSAYPGYAISRDDSSPPAVGSDSTVLAALPSGHSVARYLKGAEGHTGSWFMGNLIAGGDPVQRVAVRWYQYFSSNYAYTNEGGCLNSAKWFEPSAGTSGGLIFDTRSGVNAERLIYGWHQNPPSQPSFLPDKDCCVFGPITTETAPTSLPLSHWFRREVVLRNFDGTANTVIEAYEKDITAGTDEFKLIDTSEACTNCGSTPPGDDWPGGLITAPARLGLVNLNLFRNGTCAGYRAYSHLLVAAWNTDSGQRILEASEIEGGGGGGSNPVTSKIFNLGRRSRR